MGSLAVSGYKSKIQVSFNSGTTYADIPEQTNGTLNFANEQIEVTNKTSSGSQPIHKEFATVAFEWSATCEANWVADVGGVQAALQAAALADTTIYIKAFRQSGAGLAQVTGPVAVSRISYSQPLKDVAKVTYEFSSRGALTAGTQ